MAAIHTQATATPNRIEGEKGAVLFIVAASLVVVLGFAGLAMDLSMLQNVQTDLQNATDAAALAAASQLDGTANGINDAVAEAIATANNYYFNNDPVALTASDISFSADPDSGFVAQAAAAGNPANMRYARVDAGKTMNLAIIKVVPGVGDRRSVSAFAVAGLSAPANVICDGLLPLSPAPLKNAGGGYDDYQVGQVYNLRFAGGNDNISIGSGNFLVLDFSPITGGNSGADLVRDLLSGGASGCIGINDVYCSKPGVNAGPVRQGLNLRYDSDSDTRSNISHEDYMNGGYGNSKRILPIPMASRTPYPVFTPIDNGRDCPLYVYDVVCFFMRDRVPNGSVDVMGEFIGQCSVGDAKNDPGRPGPGGSGLGGIADLVLHR